MALAWTLSLAFALNQNDYDEMTTTMIIMIIMIIIMMNVKSLRQRWLELNKP